MNERYLEYDAETLERLHRTQLEILSDFIKICNENQLDYFMGWGSMIGVIRHKGFIPWDDDVDVAMLREDYEKVIRIIEEQWSDKYTILNTEKNPSYACSVTHLQKKGTRFVTYNARNLKVDTGICIDIFQLDNVPDDEKLRNRQIRKAWFLGRLLYLSENPRPIIPLKGISKALASAVCFCAHYGLRLFRIRPEKIYRSLQKNAVRYNQEETACVAAMFDNIPAKSVMKKEDIFPLIEMPFEDTYVKIPKNYDRYLTSLYGDYMQLPPVEDRVNHCPYILDFGGEN